ncbi:MAG: queuosine precursor transporter [Candidatus Aerophobetes bacterium]|nr:queuosine precursor transporter [Candidatus Aerophobetes bacterium]
MEKKTNILLGLFVGAIVTANLIGLKIANFGIFEASVGILVFPITFLVTDIIEEVHGKEKAKEFVLIGLITLVFALFITVLGVILPFAERSLVKEEYTKIFGTTIRIFIASIIAFTFSQMHDVWAFSFWKAKTRGKFLWLRNNLSTAVSQFSDTALFMFIAFYGISPKFTVSYVFSLIIPYWLVKVLFALFDTPFCYLGVKWLKGKERLHGVFESA